MSLPRAATIAFQRVKYGRGGGTRQGERKILADQHRTGEWQCVSSGHRHGTSDVESKAPGHTGGQNPLAADARRPPSDLDSPTGSLRSITSRFEFDCPVAASGRRVLRPGEADGRRVACLSALDFGCGAPVRRTAFSQWRAQVCGALISASIAVMNDAAHGQLGGIRRVGLPERLVFRSG